MASRREQKEQARARRHEREKQDKITASRRRRLQVLVSLSLLAAIVVLAIVLASSTGSRDSSSLTHNASAQKTVTSLLRGIPQQGEVLGNPDAKVSVSFYADLQCPICASFDSGTTLGSVTGGLPQLIRNQVRAGTVKLVYKSLCTATCVDYPTTGQQQFAEQQSAAYAAGRQGKFWNYAELFYREQGPEGSHYMTPTYLNNIAREIPGLDYSNWTSDRKDSSLAVQVANESNQANREGIHSTPTVFVTGPRGNITLPSGSQSYTSLTAAIAKVQ